jgi:pimeloyl-ACP methyl ester carboxylesterase
MCPIAAGAGVELEYETRGSGPAVLLVHDLAADHLTMLEQAAGLDDARVIAYARRGYGASGAPEPYSGTTVHEQAQDAAALLGAVVPDGATVAGQGFGALVALDLLRRHGGLAHAAVLCDTPLLALVPDAARAMAAERELLEEAVREGGPPAAVDRWLEGRATDEQRTRAREHARAFFADYAGLASLPVTRRELRAIEAPIVVLSGPRTPSHVVAASDALAALLPRASRRHDGDLVAAARELMRPG